MRSGYTTGTGALLAVEVGFKPSMVELQCTESSAIGFWEESMRAGTFCVEMVNELRADDILIGRHLPFIGSTDTQLGNRRVVMQFNGAGDVRIEKAATLAGTAFTATDHDITADKWGCFQLCCVTAGTVTIVPDSSLASATEAAAIALMGTKTSDSASLGYITVKATSGAIFNATTDALAGGSTGTPAEETNYYEGYGVMTGGITVYGARDIDAMTAAGLTSFKQGFTIGTNALVNALGSIITYKAYRD
jgi:hypothetical protein